MISCSKIVTNSGAGGGSRTHMRFPPLDFESSASANFTTPARYM